MELRHLRTFVAVAETLNISAAARRLRVTQPALSRHIHALEDGVGHPLFVRHRQGLRLTNAGLNLREHAVKALAAVDAAFRSARDAGCEENTTLRLGYYGISIWDKLLAPALEKFGRRFPRVSLTMVEQSSIHLVDHLRAGTLDVALLGTGDYEDLPGVVTEVACRVPGMVVLAADHRLAKKRALELAEVRHEEIIGFKQQEAPGRYRTFLTACSNAGFNPRVTYVASIFPELCLAVRKHMGVAFISSFASAVPHPGVVFIRLKPPGALMEIYTAHRSAAPPPARDLATLIALEAQRAARLAGGG